MGIERRSHDRFPSFKNVDLVATDASGDQRAVTILVRDASHPGLGGVYIGQEPPAEEERFSLLQDDQSLDLRLAWTRKIAEYVFIVGFQYV
jgi:hypothetical protein